MFLAATLAFAQIAQPGIPQHDPEVEALLRRRDEKRQAAEQHSTANRVPENDREALAAVVPPAIAARLANCLEQANISSAQGLAEADSWTKSGGGAYAAQCRGYALGVEDRWTEAAKAFEVGASYSGLDAVTQARLWSQAGNASLVAGNIPEALRALDAALARPLPNSLATGEIHLDRARARVASDDLKGARSDLDQAVVLAAADPLAWLLSATLARRMDDLPLAKIHIEEAVSRARNDGAVALEQGIILALLGGNDTGARAAFSRAKEVAAPGSEIATRAADYLAQLNGEPAPEIAKPDVLEQGR